MSDFAFTQFLVFSLPAAAIDACSALNPIEVAATQSVPCDTLRYIFL